MANLLPHRYHKLLEQSTSFPHTLAAWDIHHVIHRTSTEEMANQTGYTVVFVLRMCVTSTIPVSAQSARNFVQNFALPQILSSSICTVSVPLSFNAGSLFSLTLARLVARAFALCRPNVRSGQKRTQIVLGKNAKASTGNCAAPATTYLANPRTYLMASLRFQNMTSPWRGQRHVALPAYIVVLPRVLQFEGHKGQIMTKLVL